MTRAQRWESRVWGAGAIVAAALFLTLTAAEVAGQRPCGTAGGVCTTVPTYQAPPAYAYPAAAVVPVYTAVYTPRDERAPDPAAADDTAAAIRELAAEVRALRAELAAIREAAAAGSPADPAAAPKAPGKLAAVDVARQACAGCHAPGVAEAKGGGFALFADDSAAAFVNLSARDRVRMANRVKNGSMPPPPAKMNEPYRSELAAWAAGKPAVNTPKK